MNSSDSTPPKPNGSDDSAASDAPAANPPPPPLFYSRPLPLSAQYHEKVKIRPENDFSFAAESNAIPLSVPEFMLAARSYPIIFIGDDLVPSIAVGLRSKDNLFVDVKGQWEMGHYIPAYARRFPFIALGADNEDQFRLGIEDDARSTKEGSRTLFENGKESDAVKEAINLCEQFHGAFRFSIDFTTELRGAEIAEPRNLEVDLPGGEKINVGTFIAVNEEKFKAMPDDKVLQWHKKGWLHAIYFHLQSLNNWEGLMMRTSNRMAAAASIR